MTWPHPPPKVAVRKQRAGAWEVRCASCGPVGLAWTRRLARRNAADHWLGHQMGRGPRIA